MSYYVLGFFVVTLCWEPILIVKLRPDKRRGTPPLSQATANNAPHDDVIKWKHFPHNWPFVRGIYRSPVNSPHKGQWRGVLMFYLICAWINGWVKNREAGELRRHRAHYGYVNHHRLFYSHAKYCCTKLEHMAVIFYFNYRRHRKSKVPYMGWIRLFHANL